MRAFETSIHVDAPPAAVWRVLTDFPAFGDWNPMMVKVEGKPEVGTQLRLRFILRTGGRGIGSAAKVFVVEPERELRWGGGVPGLLKVEHYVKLAPDGAGTRVEHGETFRGPIVGLGFWLLGLTDGPYHAMNQALKARVEAAPQ